MSNIIPIVSSSPPPLEDDAGFGWGEEGDDDEFGNFASAAVADENDGSFEVNWSSPEATFPTASEGSNTSTNSKETAEIENSGIEEKSLKDSSILHNDEASKLPLQCESTLEFNKDHMDRTADDVEEDESGDFSHLDSNSTPESKNILLSSSVQQQSDGEGSASVNKMNTDATNVNLKSDSSHQISLNSCPDQCSDSLATDSETTSSAILKNNESLYSNASTIDSGLFSADMSPCSHPNSSSDICQTSEKEEDSTLELKEINGEKADTSDLDCISGNKKHTSSLEHDSPPEDSENDAEEDWCDFNSAVTDDSNATTFESEQRDKQDSTIMVEPEHVSKKDCVHSTSINEVEKSDHSNVIPHTPGLSFQSDSHLDSSLPDNSTSEENLSDAVNDSSGGDPSDKITTGEKDSESDAEIETKMSVGANSLCSNQHESKMDDECGQENNDENDWASFSSSAVNEAESESGAGNEDQCKLRTESPESGEVKLDNRKTDLNNTLEGQGESEISNHVEKTIVKESGVVGSSNVSSHQNSLSKSADDHLDSENEDGDIEFGDFGSYRQRKESDPHEEVAPITFRTSVCEPDPEESENEFNGDKDVPPDDNSFHCTGSSNQETASDDDDFGDFDSALQPKSEDFSSSPANNDAADDFGEFGSTDTAGDDESGWADFGSATPAVEGSEPDGFGVFGNSQEKLSPVESQQDKTLKLVLAVSSCFPESVASSSLAVDQTEKDFETTSGKTQEENPKTDNDSSSSTLKNDENLTPLDTVVELGLSKALEAKQQTWTVVQHPSKKDPKVRLWGHLKDFDSSHALEYGWPTSYCSKEIFNTLHIDTQNVLFTQKKQAVPFFASGLTILEPTRGGGDGKKEKNHPPQLQPTLVDTSKQEPQQITPQDIPPVDFDWSVSGLTNPLTANTLDLDFLVVQGSDSCEKTSDEWAWVFKADQQDAACSGLQPLEEILKKSTPTAKLATHEVLSPEALRILEKMPNLSFMQSRVLMFPVKQ